MDVGTASVIAAALTTVGTVIVAYLSKVHKDNRKDHAYVAKSIETMHSDLRDVKEDIQEVKVDVGILKERQSDIKDRVDNLERSKYV